MSNNRIEKFEHIGSLKDANQLQELALDGNPIFHLKGYFEFCIGTCPNLKHLDLRKITPEMREAGGLKGPDGKLKIGDDKGDTMSTEISPDKQPSSMVSGGQIGGGAGASDDISPEGLLEVISQEWKNEMERIKTLGLNGYKRRKESRNECLV